MTTQTNKPLRIIFAGTADFAAQHLKVLLENQAEENFTVVAVYTQPDRPAGRGKKLSQSPVKAIALKNDIAVYQPLSLKPTQQVALLSSHNADLAIVVAYGLLLPQPILDTPHFGCINVHASLLPRWRGAAPIERAILAGDTKSGVTIMQMDAGLDTGDILLSLSTEIGVNDSSAQLEHKLCALGTTALLQVVSNIATQQLHPIKQVEAESTYAHKLQKHEAHINWQLPAEKIQRQVRAFNPRSPAYCFISQQRVRILASQCNQKMPTVPAGTIIKVDRKSITVACQNSCLDIHALQLAGKNPVTVIDLLNANNKLLKVGDCFEQEVSLK